MKSGVTVRLARPAEIARIGAIERDAGRRFAEVGMTQVSDGATVPADDLRRAIEGEWLFVAEQTSRDGSSHEIVGFCLALPLRSSVHIDEISVLRARAGRGIGRVLIERVIDEAARRGHRAVTLMTFRDVPWNAPYYARLGFEIVPPSRASPELAAIVANEAEANLARSGPRVLMRFSGDSK